MEANKYFEKSEYSKIHSLLFSKKELIDFAEEYHKYRVEEQKQNKYLLENFAKQARPYRN